MSNVASQVASRQMASRQMAGGGLQRAITEGSRTILRRRWLLRVAIAGLAYVVYAAVNQGRSAGLDYFVPLADAFLNGRLSIPILPGLNELVPIGSSGYGYVVYPPMPAIVAVPFVAVFGSSVDQAGIALLFGAANVYVASGVLSRLGMRPIPWLTLSLVFAFGSIGWYSVQAGSAWHFAHVLATFFTLLAIRETQLGGNPWLMGLWFGAAALSRLPVLLAAAFFVAAFAYRARLGDATSDRPFGHLRAVNGPAHLGTVPLAQAMRLAIPFAVTAGLLGSLYLGYNWVRFGSPTEFGYELIPGLLDEAQYQNGFFHYTNIARNLQALFLSTPRLVEQPPFFQPAILGGLSLLLTTPIYLWAAQARAPTWFTLGCWGATVLVAIPVLLHADPGGAQFGYRYAQDFYPFLLLLTAHGIARGMSFAAWWAVMLGFIVNVWGMWATATNWFA